MCAYGRVLAEPRLSPDGERIAFVTNVAARGQVVVMPAKGGPEVVVTSDPPPRPVAAYGGGAFDWTPDGEALVYAAVDGGLWVTSVRRRPARDRSSRKQAERRLRGAGDQPRRDTSRVRGQPATRRGGAARWFGVADAAVE